MSIEAFFETRFDDKEGSNGCATLRGREKYAFTVVRLTLLEVVRVRKINTFLPTILGGNQYLKCHVCCDVDRSNVPLLSLCIKELTKPDSKRTTKTDVLKKRMSAALTLQTTTHFVTKTKLTYETRCIYINIILP